MGKTPGTEAVKAPDSGGGQPRRPEGAAEDAAFDHWLEDKLRTAYSSVLEEPIPEDLLRLLQQKLKD